MIIQLDRPVEDEAFDFGDVLVVRNSANEVNYYLVIKLCDDMLMVNLSDNYSFVYSYWEEAFDEDELLEIIPKNQIIISRKDDELWKQK